MPKARVTLATVARAAQVSPAAASLALNDRPGVAMATRARVLAAAKKLGYRRRAGGAERVIGVLPTDLGNPYHTDVISGIESQAEKLGMAVVIAHGRRDSDHLERQLRRLLDLDVDALIAVTTWLSPTVLEPAAQVVPTVVIGRMQDVVPGTDTVRNNDEAGAALAVRHLVSKGHRAIAHVTYSSRPGPASRRAGFLTEVTRIGLRERCIVIGPDRTDDGLEMLMRRVRAEDPSAPTAVFAANDMAAVSVLHRAAAAGVAVPEQLSVVGYDSSAVALTVRPHLTSVNQPRQAMGTLAATMLHERFSGRTRDTVSMVEPALSIRESTAAARSTRAM